MLLIWRKLDLPVPAAKLFTKACLARMMESKACLEVAQQRAARDYICKNNDFGAETWTGSHAQHEVP